MVDDHWFGTMITRIQSPNLFDFVVQDMGKLQYNNQVTTKRNTVSYYPKQDAGPMFFAAHNYLAGRQISKLQTDNTITVVLDDGSAQSFTVNVIDRYQVVGRTWTSLDTRQRYTDTEIASLVYYDPNSKIVLMTCIERNKNLSWGRIIFKGN
jgi:hypothetical protein